MNTESMCVCGHDEESHPLVTTDGGDYLTGCYHCGCSRFDPAEQDGLDVPVADLTKAYEGSWYTIAGTGGGLQKWIDGYTEQLDAAQCGTPVAWYQTTGAAINEFVGNRRDAFPDSTTFLMFPLDGMNIGALSIFKLEWQDRWFDDIVDNMKAA